VKNNIPFAANGKETTALFLRLVNRDKYMARFRSSCAIHVARPHDWEIGLVDGFVVLTFPRGRILDSQNRPFVTEMLSVRSPRILLPYDYPIMVSSLGANPRYYAQFPGACSLTLESAVAQ
jgi:hypothetical protein